MKASVRQLLAVVNLLPVVLHALQKPLSGAVYFLIILIMVGYPEYPYALNPLKRSVTNKKEKWESDSLGFAQSELVTEGKP